MRFALETHFLRDFTGVSANFREGHQLGSAFSAGGGGGGGGGCFGLYSPSRGDYSDCHLYNLYTISKLTVILGKLVNSAI